MRLIGPTDILAPAAMTQVSADLFKRLGFNQDVALSDWGTVIQRRSSKEPVGNGGWFGWPVIPALESLRANGFDAPDEGARKAICAEIQPVALDEVAYIPLGILSGFTAMRSNLVDRANGFALFWNLPRT